VVWWSSLSGHGFSRSMDFDTVSLGLSAMAFLAAWTLTLSACRLGAAYSFVLRHLVTVSLCCLPCVGLRRYVFVLAAWTLTLSARRIAKVHAARTRASAQQHCHLAGFALHAFLFSRRGLDAARVCSCAAWTVTLSACAACCMRWFLFVGTLVLSLLRASACAVTLTQPACRPGDFDTCCCVRLLWLSMGFATVSLCGCCCVPLFLFVGALALSLLRSYVFALAALTLTLSACRFAAACARSCSRCVDFDAASLPAQKLHALCAFSQH
jgi:hypothetical protein